MIQYIADGRIQNGDRAVLWRHGDYHYELEVGSGTVNKRSIDLTDTDYDEAFCMLQALCVDIVRAVA
jgi:hypothetical protein